MNFLWDNIFEYWKERRYALLFVTSMFMVFALLLIACIVGELLQNQSSKEKAVYILPGVLVVLGVWAWGFIGRFRRRGDNRYEPSPLSRDELHKARSKLRKAKE
jgi:hypothetical protein